LEKGRSNVIKSILIDKRNWEEESSKLIQKLREAPYSGFDIETHNRFAHEGAQKQKVFDIFNTVICGASFYPKGDEQSYYVNLNHADEENRITFEQFKSLLVAPLWIIHNASFELTMLKAVYGLELENYLCTMQMCVSTYGPDNYDWNKFCSTPLGEISKLLPSISKEFTTYDINSKRDLTTNQAELLGQVAGKSSTAAHSYNGWVDSIAYGYGLKKAVKSFFDCTMTEYKDCLAKSNYAKTKTKADIDADMGHLTGGEVTSYGADDAYWCLRLYEHLQDLMIKNCPNALQAFYGQENKMIKLYSDIQVEGLRIDEKAVLRKRDEERVKLAQVYRDLKAEMKKLLPFPTEINEGLAKAEGWYVKNWLKYRQKIEEFINSPDFEDEKRQIQQVDGGGSNSYGESKQGLINLSHYMPQRVLFYDLMGHKLIKAGGKVQSDKDTRGKLLESYEKDTPQYKILELLNTSVRIDQVCKLYLNPYLNLIHPKTGKVHPSIGSELATRRMSMSNPNGQQLAKKGESVYVRGFYLPDSEDHVIISADWKTMELFIPAEMSGDPELLSCFTKIPYDDLHSVAAAAMLGLSDEEFESLRHLPSDTDNIRGIQFKNNKGEMLEPKKFRGWARNVLGKGANFSYAFSGALSQLAESLGWSDETHWAKVEAYRNRFNVFEDWRVGLINEAKQSSFVELPDGHRRTRIECTPQWRDVMQSKFIEAYNSTGVKNFFNKFAKLQQTRGNNQIVNAMVQGTAAAITKRSLWSLTKRIEEKGWSKKQCRIMLPIHDEIVVSVHKDLTLEFIALIREVMCSHGWLFKKVLPFCTVSIGRTFEPFHPIKAPLGQIELDEAPEVDFIPEDKWDKSLNNNEILNVVEYLFK
jgi:DNA polymerase I-like protein with 3'-5' exonuclease and polymerase domains